MESKRRSASNTARIPGSTPTGRGRRSGVALSVSLVYRLGGGEEARIFGRVDLNRLDDRHEAARSQDRRWPIGLRFWGNPVVRRGGEHGVSPTVRDLRDLEVADADAQPIRRDVRAQLGGHRRTDLDGEHRRSVGQGDLSWPGPFPDRPPRSPAGEAASRRGRRTVRRDTRAAPCRKSRPLRRRRA